MQTFNTFIEQQLSEEKQIPNFVDYTDEHTTDDYPFGRLRATATWTVEKKGQKARISRVTINPKTGRVNKPKKTTYGVRATIGLTSDGKAYPILLTEYGQILIMSGDMKTHVGYFYDKDSGYDKLFNILKNK